MTRARVVRRDRHVAGLLLPLAFVFASAAVAAEGTEEPESGMTRAVRIAVSDLELSGVEDNVGGVFTESLLAEMRKLQRVSVISMDEVRAMLDLEAQKQMAGCEDEESCLADIAGALGADVLVVGSLARVGDESIVALKRIDQREAKVTGQVNKRLTPAGGEEYLAAIGPVVEELFPDHELRPGQERGVSPEMALRLNPPPVPTWVFWSGVGVTSGAAIASVAAGVWWALNQASYSAAAERSVASITDGRTLKASGDVLVLSEAVMWSLSGTTLGLALATAVVTPFVDWQGVADE